MTTDFHHTTQFQKTKIQGENKKCRKNNQNGKIAENRILKCNICFRMSKNCSKHSCQIAENSRSSFADLQSQKTIRKDRPKRIFFLRHARNSVEIA